MSGIKPHTGPSAATAMRHVLKENMKDIVLDVREYPAYIRSLLRITAYKDHNKLIKDEFKQRIQILDEKYGSYTMWMDIVQVSIIVLAASSSFIQAGNDIINLDKAIISFISLIISSYTGLVLALAKYKKIDEKKETINNLRHQCADFLTQIQTRTDKLNTWCYDRMWAGGNINKMAEAWAAEDEQLYSELKPLIEKKQVLTCEFERILDSLTVKKTSKLVRARDLKYKKQSIEFTELEDNLEEKESTLESERKKKIQRAFYNTDYTQNRVDRENKDNIKEKDEIINALQGQIKYYEKMNSTRDEYEENKRKIGNSKTKSRSHDRRRGRSRTRSSRRSRSPVRNGLLYTDEEDEMSDYSSSSSIDISLTVQEAASRLRKLVKLGAKNSPQPFNHFSCKKEYFTREMFREGLKPFPLTRHLDKEQAYDLFKMIDIDCDGKVYIKDFMFFIDNAENRSLSPPQKSNEKYLEGDNIKIAINDPTIPNKVILSKRIEDFKWNMYIKTVSKLIDRWKSFVIDSKIESMVKWRAFRKLKKILNKKNDILYDSSGNVIKGEENV